MRYGDGRINAMKRQFGLCPRFFFLFLGDIDGFYNVFNSFYSFVYINKYFFIYIYNFYYLT